MNKTEYFLTVNGNPIGLNFQGGLEDTTDLLNLCIFTGNYVSSRDLLMDLLQMGVYKGSINEPVRISIKKGNKRTGFTYEPIDFFPIYRDRLQYMSSSKLKDIITTNRTNTDFLYRIFSHFQIKYANIAESLSKKITDNREHPNSNVTSDRLLKTFNTFAYAATNMDRLIVLSKVNNSPYAENELVQRLQAFIEGQTKYVFGNKSSVNSVGLVELAQIVLSNLEMEENPIYPKPTTLYDEKKKHYENQVQSIIKARLQVISSTKHSDDDPDKWMFLEAEDYTRMITENTSPEMLESIAVDLEKHNSSGKSF